MADNRLWLINERLGVKVLLAKYLQSTGWYQVSTMTETLDWAFDHDDDHSDLGPVDWELVYATSNRPLGHLKLIPKQLLTKR